MSKEVEAALAWAKSLFKPNNVEVLAAEVRRYQARDENLLEKAKTIEAHIEEYVAYGEQKDAYGYLQDTLGEMRELLTLLDGVG